MRNSETSKKDLLPSAARGSTVRSTQASVDVLSAKVDKLMALQEQILSILKATPPSVPPPTSLAPLAANVDAMARQVYESTLRAITDKEEYEEKEKRVVVNNISLITSAFGNAPMSSQN
ncbi:hypothetical protein PRIPAC_73354 [Pristionchus pacificus]|uniref:Uncharacterized protein n=1 Tax=Pristionchus pacificus TaxID=54126 RepID=A0A2A6CFA6_PRIPA|nr:hypothetical protein PRIPAC_73354 [Pristionchus pacificus]|eukprot:PDM76767.1 hypothetical protein PRIPAC_42162 [Pristionchus pacificus]